MEGYKGFYKTDNDLFVMDLFSNIRTIGVQYYLDDKDEIMMGHGFHFAEKISKTMPHFGFAIKDGMYRVAKIETIGEIVENKTEHGCFMTRGYQINSILNHDDIIHEIKRNISQKE